MSWIPIKARVSSQLPATSPFVSAPVATGQSKRRCFGLMNRKERWGLSRRGWLVLVSSTIAAAGLFLFGSHPFLAISDRKESDVLVVEGWVHEYTLRAAVEEFNAGSYKRVFTTGGPVPGLGRYVNDWQTLASVGADGLKNAGIPEEVVQMVPARETSRNRTYASAVALRKWLEDQNIQVGGFNVLTEDAHARRTRLLFQEAFGSEVSVGVISVANPDYDSKRWWRYSEGVREVLGETVAYIYAKAFFWPERKRTEDDKRKAEVK